MDLNNRTEVEKDTAQVQSMLPREIPKMLGYVVFFYGILGVGIPWRADATKNVIWSSVKASVLFGLISGIILLAVGAMVMSMYLTRKAYYVGFSPGASQTMILSFRIFGFVGVPLALWDIFKVIFPIIGSEGENLVHDWLIWLLLIGGLAGWFAGRSVGGLIGLLAIRSSGRKILSQL